jgi:hypothetical protein
MSNLSATKQIFFLILYSFFVVFVYKLIIKSNINYHVRIKHQPSSNIIKSVFRKPNANPHPRKYVYFDLGTNNGDSVLGFLHQKRNYPNILDRNIVEKNRWEIYMFEANPYTILCYTILKFAVI